jgi:thiamine-monophosphate kinase
LFTVPLSMHEKIGSLKDITIIGHTTKESLGCNLITRDGQEFVLKAQGWNGLLKNE